MNVRAFLRGLVSKPLFKVDPNAWRYAKVSFSQFGEDVYVNHILNDRPQGFYVDIGAYSPFDLSNTYFFYRKGWRGICVEPNPLGAELLRKFRPGDVVVQTVVSDQSSQLDYVMFEGGATNRVNQGIATDNSPLKTVKFQAITLSDLLHQHLPTGVSKIDLLSVDCEGHDLAILRGNNWQKFRPEVIIAEDTVAPPSELESFLSAQGYLLYAELTPSKIFVQAPSR